MFASSNARADFQTARRKAFWRQVRSWLFRGDNALLAFEDVRRQLHAQAQHEGGNQTVPIDQIIGSVGRYRDFDRAFLPRGDRTRGRWESLDRAHHEGVGLPAIELYELGTTYFVKDGNHRVSVARERGQKFIDARVVVVVAPAPISSADDLMDWIRDQDALAFHATTRISQLRPGARIDLTLPGQYEKLLAHIDTHRWFLGLENHREMGYDEAVQSWYDRVYLPTIEAIRASGALRDFHHRTEADLYVWITEHHWYMHQHGLPRGHGLEQLVSGYAHEHSERPLKRLGRTIRRGR